MHSDLWIVIETCNKHFYCKSGRNYLKLSAPKDALGPKSNQGCEIDWCVFWPDFITGVLTHKGQTDGTIKFSACTLLRAYLLVLYSSHHSGNSILWVHVYVDTRSNICVMPVLLYGCENWVLTEQLISRLETFQGELAKESWSYQSEPPTR